jgi:hypothetical protein
MAGLRNYLTVAARENSHSERGSVSRTASERLVNTIGGDPRVRWSPATP